MKNKQHLKQRAVTQAALGVLPFYDLVERHLLIGVGIKGHFADSPQQLAKGWIAGEIGRSTRVLMNRPIRARVLGGCGRTRGTDDDVFLPRPSEEQGIECGAQRHEERRPLLTTQRFELLLEFWTKQLGMHAATERLNSSWWPISREVEERCRAGEPIRPVPKALIGHAIPQPVGFPAGKIAVLQGNPATSQPAGRRSPGRGSPVLKEPLQDHPSWTSGVPHQEHAPFVAILQTGTAAAALSSNRMALGHAHWPAGTLRASTQHRTQLTPQ